MHASPESHLHRGRSMGPSGFFHFFLCLEYPSYGNPHHIQWPNLHIQSPVLSFTPSYPLLFHPGDGRHANSSCARIWRVSERQIGIIELSCVSTRLCRRIPKPLVFTFLQRLVLCLEKCRRIPVRSSSGVDLNLSAHGADADQLQPTRRADHRPPLTDLTL